MATYDPTTALLVVDVQNDFADPDGSLYVSGSEAVVPYVSEQIAATLDAGGSVVYTQDWNPESTPHFAKDGGIWPVHCVHDTWGAAFHPALRLDGAVVRKGSNGEDGYSGFSMREQDTGRTVPTELSDLLWRAGANRLVVCGLATDYCVMATVLDGRTLEYPVSVLAHGVRAVNLKPGDDERAFETMRAAGATIDNDP
jgi:nicotinamidase/pyrazinamidase